MGNGAGQQAGLAVGTLRLRRAERYARGAPSIIFTANGRHRVPDRAFALYRALFGIDELTQEKGTIRELRLVHPKKYAKDMRDVFSPA